MVLPIENREKAFGSFVNKISMQSPRSASSCMKKKKKFYVSDVLKDIIMYEILTRLPIKSLFRFKLVCRKWQSLITQSPLFITNYSHNRANLYSCSSFYFDKLERVISSDDQYQFKLSKPKFLNKFDDIEGSTNGFFYGYCYKDTKIFIFNPITKQVVYIPNNKPRKLPRSLALASDPYNPNNGFSLIGLVSPQRPNRFQFKVYSSKKGEWRMSNAELLVPSQELLRVNGPVCTGGKVYWSIVRHIVWFDVGEDVAGLVECPSKCDLVILRPCDEDSYMEIGVCNGVLSYSKMTREGHIEIWLLRNRGGHEFEWVKRHNVRFQGIVKKDWNIMSQFFPIMEKCNRKAVVDNLIRHRSIYPLPYEGGEVLWFWMNVKKKLFSINLRTRELRVINEDLSLPAWPFVPTLLPCPT